MRIPGLFTGILVACLLLVGNISAQDKTLAERELHKSIQKLYLKLDKFTNPDQKDYKKEEVIDIFKKSLITRNKIAKEAARSAKIERDYHNLINLLHTSYRFELSSDQKENGRYVSNPDHEKIFHRAFHETATLKSKGALGKVVSVIFQMARIAPRTKESGRTCVKYIGRIAKQYPDKVIQGASLLALAYVIEQSSKFPNWTEVGIEAVNTLDSLWRARDIHSGQFIFSPDQRESMLEILRRSADPTRQKSFRIQTESYQKLEGVIKDFNLDPETIPLDLRRAYAARHT